MSSDAYFPAPEPPPPPAADVSQAERDYVFAGLAALLVVFVALTVRGGGGPVAGVVVAGLGTSALLFRWTVMPVVFLLLLAYLIVFPFGLPFFPLGSDDTLHSQFRVQDMLLAAAVLIYLKCQYRVIGLTTEAMPPDRAAANAPPTRRPAAAVPDGEFPRMLVAAAAVVLAGQVVWYGLTALSLDLRSFPPVTIGPPPPVTSGPPRSSFVPAAPLSRTLLLAGAVAVGGVAARFGFWYWRLTRLTPDEGRMILLDAGWREARRELNRQEKWRAWGRARAARKRGGAG